MSGYENAKLKEDLRVLQNKYNKSKLHLEIAVYLIDDIIQSHGGTRLLDGDNVWNYLSKLKLESTKYDDWWENWGGV